VTESFFGGRVKKDWGIGVGGGFCLVFGEGGWWYRFKDYFIWGMNVDIIGLRCFSILYLRQKCQCHGLNSIKFILSVYFIRLFYPGDKSTRQLRERDKSLIRLCIYIVISAWFSRNGW